MANMDYRHKIDALIITLPEGLEEENRKKDICCPPKFKVFAHEFEAENYKNDITGRAIKAFSPGDTVDFKITTCEDPATPLDLLGEVGIYPQEDFVFGFMFDWKQYLIQYGIGKYHISASYTISGITAEIALGEFDLCEYSIEAVKDSVRIQAYYNSKSIKDGIDYTNSNHVDTLRFNGFFGDADPNTEINNLVTKGKEVEKSTREDINLYRLETDPIEIQISRVLRQMLLNEDKLLVSDHNRLNHDYILFDKGVVPVEPLEPEYHQYSRLATFKITLGDRKQLDKSYFNLIV